MSITINSVDTTKFELKQKEGKRLKFTYDVDINDATFSLIVVNSSGTTVITKANTDFDTTSKANQIVYVTLTTTDLDLDAGIYEVELKTIWNASTNVDKTETMKMKIKPSLFT